VTFEVTMPQMGADMTEGTLIRWLKQVGDHIERGDILAEVETDKATVELEAFEAGDLLRQLVVEGEEVPVGEVIAILGDKSEAVADKPRMAPPEHPARRTPDPVAPGATAQPEVARAEPARTPVAAGSGASAQQTDGRVRISPVARRIASQAGLDVSTLSGSGPDGRILRRDVEAAISGGAQPAAAQAAPLSPAAAPAPVQRPAVAATAAERPQPAAAPAEALSRMRQAIARRMTQSKQTQPHYYLTLDVDMTAAIAFRAQLNAAATEQQRVSINDLIVKACAIALQRHPKFNSEFSESGLVMHPEINIDIGIAMDEGLIAPAILDCGSKSLGRIAEEAKDLIERAKSGRLTASEYSDGTFTITNLGAYGVESLIGIINPPQAAILGVGSAMAKPVVVEDQVVVRQVMKLALSADHRVSDGAEGARFIKEIQGLLENPVTLAL
jgi:pyruvate dehydrogenase E2 component (dihydrolipoamide acetyltransferase)